MCDILFSHLDQYICESVRVSAHEREGREGVVTIGLFILLLLILYYIIIIYCLFIDCYK